MSKLIEVAINDLRVTFSENGIWINLVLIPVALVFIIGIAAGGSDTGEENSIRVDLIDNDNTEISAQFMDLLRLVNPTLRLCPFDRTLEGEDGDLCGLNGEALSAEQARQRLEDDETNVVITIPSGFGEAVFNGTPMAIDYLSTSDATQVDPLLQSVQAAVTRVGGASVAARVATLAVDQEEDEIAQLSQAVYEDAARRWASPPVQVTYLTSSGEDGSEPLTGFSQSTPGMGTMYVMFTVLAGAVIMLRERKQWTLQRLITMPVSRVQLLGGKVVSRFIMGMIQYGVAFAAGAVLGASFGNDPAGLLLIMVSFTLCITALTFVLASLVDREEQANSLATFVVLVAAPLGGAWWPLEIVPDFMQKLAYISPVGWAMTAFNELIVYNGTVSDVLLHAGVLLTAAVLLFGIAVSRFSYE